MPRLSEEMLKCVYRGDVSGVGKVLASGESPDATDADGRNALMHAVLAKPPNRAVIAALVTAGTNVTARDLGQGWAVLAFAARDCTAEICRMIVDAGAEIDAKDSFGNTALWRAVMARNEQAVALLLACGADLDCSNNSGVSPRVLSERLGWDLPRVG